MGLMMASTLSWSDDEGGFCVGNAGEEKAGQPTCGFQVCVTPSLLLSTITESPCPLFIIRPLQPSINPTLLLRSDLK